MKLFEALSLITPLNEKAKKQALQYQDSLIKPLGSLGKLEDIAIQIAGITGDPKPEKRKKCIIVMCSDNGVCTEGVSACPQSVTMTQAINFTKGNSGINVLSKQAGSDLIVVDIGIASEYDCDAIVNKNIAKGTKNMAIEPAMTREEAVTAIEAGIQIVENLSAKGYNLIGTGEMGIGNTSTSSAVLMALSGMPATDVVGKGAGLTEADYIHKIRIIEQALAVNQPDVSDPIDVLSKVGGFDIAGMAGCFIGGAACKTPVVIDGFISAVAALIACRIHPGVKDYLIPSHASAEPGYQFAMKAIGLSPSLLMNMRLGEGTGCALMFMMIDAALAIVHDMDTFEKGNITNDFMVDIREDAN